MSAQNTVVFGAVATNEYWGEGSNQSWYTTTPTKTASGFQYYDVQLDDPTAQASNAAQIPASVSIYKFDNWDVSVPPESFSSHLLSTTAMTSKTSAGASTQALSALETMYGNIIASTKPTQIVVTFSGHGNQQIFFQGSLLVPDAIKLMTYLKVTSNGATVVLDEATNCLSGSYDNVRTFQNSVDYFVGSEKEYGTGAPITGSIDQNLATNPQGSLTSDFTANNTTLQSLKSIVNNEIQNWTLFNYTGLAKSVALQDISVFQENAFQSFIAQLGKIPSSAYASMQSTYDISSYIMSSGNQALITAYNNFLVCYADNSADLGGGDGTHGLGLGWGTQTELMNRAMIAAGSQIAGASVASEIVNFTKVGTYSGTLIQDSAANVISNIDAIESMLENRTANSPNYYPTLGIELTDSGTATLSVNLTQLLNDPLVFDQIYTAYNLVVSAVPFSQMQGVLSVGHVTRVGLLDSAANISANLDALEAAAIAGKLSSITLTDSGVPTLSITPAQASSDAAVLNYISGTFSVTQTAAVSNMTISGASANALGNTVVLSGSASQYIFAPSGDGVCFTVTTAGSTDHLSNVQALQFDDCTLIVAQTPGSCVMPTAGNITELYAAVFGRLPDLAGLTYYTKELQTNPTLSLTQLAQNFLASAEYTGNTTHNYAQTQAGDIQFITDAYNNLLHRSPGTGEAAWYVANVIAPLLVGQTPGTAGYTAAENLAHACVITDFSASAEFLNDVTVTGTHPADATHWLVLI